MPYLTPETVPEERACRALLIPDNSEWLALISGALTELQFRWNWEVQGITIDETLAVVNEIIDGYYTGCLTSGCEQPDGFPIFRLTPDGHVEMLQNGEYVEPYGDYAIPPIPAREEPTPEENKCLAAANAVYVLEQVYEIALDAIQDGVQLVEFVARIIEGLGTLAFFAGTITAWFAGLWIAAWEFVFRGLALLTVDLWDLTFTDELRCVFYECATDNAGVVTFDYQCIMEKLNDPEIWTDLTLEKFRLLLQLEYIIMNIGGVDGLNQAGASTAVTEANCEGCDQPPICVTFDEESYPWTYISFPDTTGEGTTDTEFGDPAPSGMGYHDAVGMYLGLEIELPSVMTVDAISLYYYYFHNSAADVFVRQVLLLDSEDEVLYEFTSVFGGVQEEWTFWEPSGFTPVSDVAKIRFYFGASATETFAGDCWVDNVCIAAH